MITDAFVEIVCDNDCCDACEKIELPFVYGGTMHTSGHYDHDDDSVMQIAAEVGWTRTDGKHFCEMHSDSAKAGTGRAG